MVDENKESLVNTKVSVAESSIVSLLASERARGEFTSSCGLSESTDFEDFKASFVPVEALCEKDNIGSSIAEAPEVSVKEWCNNGSLDNCKAEGVSGKEECKEKWEGSVKVEGEDRCLVLERSAADEEVYNFPGMSSFRAEGQEVTVSGLEIGSLHDEGESCIISKEINGIGFRGSSDNNEVKASMERFPLLQNKETEQLVVKKTEATSLLQVTPYEDAPFMATEGVPNFKPLQVKENCHIEHLLLPETQETVENNAGENLALCIGSSDPIRKLGNSRTANMKASSMIIIRRTNPKRAATLKSSSKTEGNSNQVMKSKSKKDGQACHADPMKIFSNTVKRKRSHCHKHARGSVWGAVEHITSIFKQNEHFHASNSSSVKRSHRKSRRGISFAAISKRRTCQRDNAHVLKGKVCLSSDHNPSCESDTSITENVCEQEDKLSQERRGSEVDMMRGDAQYYDKDLESTLTHEAAPGNSSSDCAGVSRQVRTGPLVVVDQQFAHSGTSPDSVVSHQHMDDGFLASEVASAMNQDTGTGQSVEMVERTLLDASKAGSWTSCEAAPTTLSLSLENDIGHHTIKAKCKKGRKGVEGNVSSHESPQYPDIVKDIEQSFEKSASSYSVLEANIENRFWESGLSARSDSKNCKIALKFQGSHLGSILLSKDAPGFGQGQQTMQNVGNAKLESLKKVDYSMASKPRKDKNKIMKSISARENQKRSQNPDPAGRLQQSCSSRNKATEQRRSFKDKSLDNNLAIIIQAQLNEGKPGIATNASPQDLSSSTEIRLCTDVAPKESYERLHLDQCTKPRNAWVLCDDCQKWRCIPPELADHINETNCRWTCKDNTDKAFANCSTPQEKTDAEINAELDISDEEGILKPVLQGCLPHLAASGRDWKRIKSNLFLHRNRRTQKIDEVMVCCCKAPSDGSMGCGAECLNRMINIECVLGTCPCSDLCSNQQFQRRNYAKLKLIHCGKKGYGLQLQQDVSEGQFLIEYVGEVLDVAAYEARQKHYAARGQQHFYFMTLTGGEVIDACAKGNLGRFINHSCNPNCETQKWTVNGEICIGIFALRDIKEGEEVTFDYNYERVFGAAVKKCVCGSSRCRGFIGGNPLNNDIIIQDDSDEDYPESVLVRKDAKCNDDEHLDEKRSMFEGRRSKLIVEMSSSQSRDALTECFEDILEPKIQLQDEYTISGTSSPLNQPDTPVHISDPVQSEEFILSDSNVSDKYVQVLELSQREYASYKPSPNIEDLQSSSSLPIIACDVADGNPIPDVQPVVAESISLSDFASEDFRATNEYRSEQHSDERTLGLASPPAELQPAEKATCQDDFMKRDKCIVKVEGELNRLLNGEGGISKRKDATKGYLKLLFLTAAAGNHAGGASQSIRELSLVLDALLKTKSRMVLTDIINKNGLQMLHNIMKQNRDKFNRIPILRKLLKVLDFLAVKRILTPEHMNSGPPCSGMESFKESILGLTRHKDAKVHHIARNFRDKYFRHNIEFSSREDCMMESLYTHSKSRTMLYRNQNDQVMRDSNFTMPFNETIRGQTSCESKVVGKDALPHSQSVCSSTQRVESNTANGNLRRKRKSRWDQPSDTSDPLWNVGRPFVKDNERLMKNDPSDKGLTDQCIDDEVPPGFVAPPGFGSPPGFGLPTTVPSDCLVSNGEVVMGYVQERYQPYLYVSYGLPVGVMKQLGTPESGGSHSNPNWIVAPGMPFHPFPPLPSYPRPSGNTAQLVDPSCLEKFGERRKDRIDVRSRMPLRDERDRGHASSSERKFAQPNRDNCESFHGHRPRWRREKDDHELKPRSIDGAPGFDLRHERRGSC